MHSFFILTKLFFLSGFNVNKKKKNQSSAFQTLGVSLLIFAGIAALFAWNALNSMKMDPNTFLVFAVIAAALIALVMSLPQMQSAIFHTNDYEMLESLPIKKWVIVASKITSIYLVNVAEDIAIMVPVVIMYMIYGGTANGLVVGLICIPFMSLLSLLISAVIGAISAVCTARSRHATIITLIINLIFTFGLMGIYLWVMFAGKDNMDAATHNIFLAEWILNAINGHYLYYLYYVLLSLGSFALVVLFISLLYRPVNASMNAGIKKITYTGETRKEGVESLAKTLFKKEWKQFCTKPSYVLNCVVGPVMGVVMGILFVVAFPNMMSSANATAEELAATKMTYVLMTPAICVLMASLVAPASASVSFEGRCNYELLKSYPLDPTDIIKAKYRVSNVVAILPNVLVSIIMIVFLICIGITEPVVITELALLPGLTAAVCSAASMLTGLKWPKLDYENESQVTKNSAAGNYIYLFVGLPCLAIIIGLVMANMMLINNLIAMYCIIGGIAVAYIVAIAVLVYFINKKGTAMFNNIGSK